MRAKVINNFGVRSCLVNIVECSADAFAVKLHGLHPILKVSNFLSHNQTHHQKSIILTHKETTEK